MRIALIGTGSWGTAMAGLVGSHGHDVVMWSYDADPAIEINEHHTNSCYLKDYMLPDCVNATCSHEEALSGADAAIFAVPHPSCAASLTIVLRISPTTFPSSALPRALSSGAACS